MASSSSLQQEEQERLNNLENANHIHIQIPTPQSPRGIKRTHRSLSSASFRKKSDPIVFTSREERPGVLKQLIINLKTVIFGTKLFVLFPAIPLAILSHYCNFPQAWTFVFSLLALIPLAERVSFLTEQIAFFTGPTVGGLLNATCGNATELIIAIFALYERKIDVVKFSLIGSILSNLLLVLGTSLLCGGVANLKKEQKYNRKQADVNFLLLFMGLLCHTFPLMLNYTRETDSLTSNPVLLMSRVISLVMLIAYVSFLVFQLKTHRQFFEAQVGEDDDDDALAEVAVVSFASGIAWLAGMTVVIALLSEFIVGTIEDASSSWGISVSFLSIILLPIVGNAAEHAGSVIFAFKDKLDISLGVSLGSATQISLFVVPLIVIVGWIGGIEMDLDLHLLETGALALSILITAATLQDGTSNYMKGLVLIFCYIVIAACFLFVKTPSKSIRTLDMDVNSTFSV